jgi:hypothetical protein
MVWLMICWSSWKFVLLAFRQGHARDAKIIIHAGNPLESTWINP